VERSTVTKPLPDPCSYRAITAVFRIGTSS
jgi:hypothetical protein